MSVAPRRRSLGPVSVQDLVGVLASCLIVVLAFSPFVVGGRTLSAASKTAGTNGFAPFPGQERPDYATDFRPDQGASSWALEPWAEVTHRAYASGEVPLWNPYQAAGAPLAANMQSAVFDPLLLPVNVHPSEWTWDLAIISAFVLGAAAAYVFARVLGLSIVPSVVTSAAFSLSGWFFLYSNNGFCRSYVYLPILFLLVELVTRSRRLLPVLGLGVALAGNIAIGMPEASVLVIGSAAFYAVVRLVQERRAMPVGVSLLRLGGAGLLGLLLTAPLVLLFLEYEPLSFNLHKPEFVKGTGTDPQWGLLNWLVPFFSESPSPTSNVRNWIGVAVGIAALVGLSGRTETRRLHAWFFATLAGAILLKVYEFRVFDRVGQLPIVEQIVFPTFAAPVASFAFAVLAGIGVHVVSSGDLRLRRFAILLGGAAVLLLAFLLTGDRPHVIGNPPGDYAAAVWGRGAFFALLAVGAILLAAYGRRWAPLLLAAVVVAELFVLSPVSIYAKRQDPYRPPAWVQDVRTAFGPETNARVLGIDSMLYPNTAGALGLQDVRMLDALYIERYLRYVTTFLAPKVFDRFTGDERPVLLRENPMLDALSVRAIVSKSNLSGVPGLRLVARHGAIRVYENTRAYPRAWVVHDLHVVGGEEEAFAFLESRSRRERGGFVVDAFDPRRAAVVEAAGEDAIRDLRGAAVACADGARDRVSLERYSSNSVALRVDAACPGLLVLPDAFYPGWRVTVDGRASTIFATDGAFRGVIVPKGVSRVEFRYEPTPFRVGLAFALAGLVAFAVVLCAVWWRARRRRPGADESRSLDAAETVQSEPQP